MERTISMSNLLKTVFVGALLAVGLAFTSAVYAEQSPSANASNSRIGSGMRNGGMMGMPGGMKQMGGMMEDCSGMMQNRNKPPNSQFHKPPQPSPKE